MVFKAEHRMMERLVALKIIRKDLMNRPTAVERFRQEVKAAARLAHPHIVTAYDAEQAGEVHFLVMEFVDGKSLDRLLTQRTPIAVCQACEWIRQTALGLQHAWEQGMVHRDIKPANLLLTPGGQVKILDFGLARFANEAAAGGTLTPDGSMVGTPDYMAPEQAAVAASADIRADIYSLGCTLYHLLEGITLFPEGALQEKLHAHQIQQPRALSELRGDVPAELAHVVRRLLAKDPAQRYQTPAEVARALTPFAAGAWQTALMGNGEPNGRSPQSPARELAPARGEVPSNGLKISPTGTAASREAGHPVRWSAGLPKIARGPWRVTGSAAVLLIAAGLISAVISHYLRHEGRGSTHATHEGPAVIVHRNSAQTARPDETAAPGPLRCIGGQTGKFVRVAFAPGCRRALAAGADHVLHLWDLQSAKETARLTGHTDEILGLAISPDGRRALSASKDRTARLWNLDGHQMLHILRGHLSWVRGVDFLPDEPYAVSGGNDARLLLWDLQDGRPVKEFKGHTTVVGGVSISRFGRYVASSSWDKTIRVWDLLEGSDGREIRETHIYRGHADAVPTVAYSHDGRYLLSGSLDQTLRLWDVRTEAELRCFRGHKGAVNSVALSADNRWALSGGADHSVRLWDVVGGRERFCFQGHMAPVVAVAFCPAGGQAVSAAEDGILRFW
jgi:hypothetical protein